VTPLSPPDQSALSLNGTSSAARALELRRVCDRLSVLISFDVVARLPMLRARVGRANTFDHRQVGGPATRAGARPVTQFQNSMERAMRLTSTQVERTLSQFEAQAIPDNDPVVPRLSGLFGDHTFFLDDNGLSVLEPTEPTEPGVQACKIVNLANWTDSNLTSLAPHAPEPTGVVVVLEARH
jgi:hypothetical protein